MRAFTLTSVVAAVVVTVLVTGCDSESVGLSDQKSGRVAGNGAATADAAGTPSGETATANGETTPAAETPSGPSTDQSANTIQVVPPGEDVTSTTDANASGADQQASIDVAAGAPSASTPADSGAGSGAASGSSGTTTGTAAPSTASRSDSDAEALASCAKSDGRRIMFVSETANQVTADAVALYKVTGNKSRFTLKVTGSEELSGLCLFVTGNQSHVSLDVQTSIGSLIVVSRGNGSVVDVVVPEGRAVRAIAYDRKGHGGTLSVTGPGAYPAP